MLRTHNCGELNIKNVAEKVVLSGWVNKARNMGGMIFVDVRDRYGITQVTLDPQHVDSAVMKEAETLKNEYVIQVTWEVVARPDNMKNKDMSTGDIELIATDIKILNVSKVLPFPIVDDPKTSEENRFKHRFIDLRRNPVIENIKFRAKMNHFTRNWFTDNWFLEVQTPLFTVSSPEWARDFLIPSRVNPWKFYALPQAPQQYKQLLMVGGIDKYFQIAPCFRDEDPRADRHSCEFYQIDCEMSFVEQKDVFMVAESFVKDLVETLVPEKKVTVSFVQIPHAEALARYGSDKPDLRFGMEFVDLSNWLKDSDFGVFANAVKDGGVVKAIKLEGQSLSRKDLDSLTEVAKQAGAGGLAYMIMEEDGPKSPIIKFLSDVDISEIVKAMDAKIWDILFFGAGSHELVAKVLNKVRLELRDRYNLADKNALAFAWITDFPFYEWDDGAKKWDFGHNPFSHVVWGIDALDVEDLWSVQTNQYDMVCNWYEILSWSIRNHDPRVMVKAFEKVWKDPKEVEERFGAMYEAFQYGCPPHGWFAFGFDRMLMIFKDEENIREIYAFPKSWKAEDVMMWAPAAIDPAELKILNIKVDLPDMK